MYKSRMRFINRQTSHSWSVPRSLEDALRFREVIYGEFENLSRSKKSANFLVDGCLCFCPISDLGLKSMPNSGIRIGERLDFEVVAIDFEKECVQLTRKGLKEEDLE